MRLAAIYITHGHADHWIGLSHLLERFPDARTLATGKVRERAVFEATNPGLSAYWQSTFPGEIPGAEDWIASLDQIAALEPRIVVSGHKRVGGRHEAPSGYVVKGKL